MCQSEFWEFNDSTFSMIGNAFVNLEQIIYIIEPDSNGFCKIVYEHFVRDMMAPKGYDDMGFFVKNEPMLKKFTDYTLPGFMKIKVMDTWQGGRQEMIEKEKRQTYLLNIDKIIAVAPLERLRTDRAPTPNPTRKDFEISKNETIIRYRIIGDNTVFYQFVVEGSVNKIMNKIKRVKVVKV